MPKGIYKRTKPHSKETKRKLSDIAKKRFKNPKNHPLYGKYHSKETLFKMSEVKKGKHLSPKTEFKKGHKTWNKGIPRSDAVKKAVSKANYKNGKIRTAQGYILKLQRNNPHRRKRYILEHRLIMEKILGRYLTKKEKVHHINGIKHDNRPQNLHLVAQSPHYGKICCPFCSKEFLIR